MIFDAILFRIETGFTVAPVGVPTILYVLQIEPVA